MPLHVNHRACSARYLSMPTPPSRPSAAGRRDPPHHAGRQVLTKIEGGRVRTRSRPRQPVAVGDRRARIARCHARGLRMRPARESAGRRCSVTKLLSGSTVSSRPTMNALSVTGLYGFEVAEHPHAGAKPPKGACSLKPHSPLTVLRRYASECVVTAKCPRDVRWAVSKTAEATERRVARWRT